MFLFQALFMLMLAFGLFWFIVWLWEHGSREVGAWSHAQRGDRCRCGKHRLVGGIAKFDDGVLRHAAVLCQPLRETIDR